MQKHRRESEETGNDMEKTFGLKTVQLWELSTCSMTVRNKSEFSETRHRVYSNPVSLCKAILEHSFEFNTNG